MKIQDIHKLFLKCNSICIDTRKIQHNCFFVALNGEHFNANTFAKQALEKGASYVIIDNASFFIDERTILVEDSLLALQDLASFHRKHLNIPIIALTGSNGKTTTKELIHLVLSKKYNTKATYGNLNNHIGVPLTLLSFDETTEIGVVEMGANHQKEIDFLCELAHPDYGYITNFGKAHLEGFGGVEGVIKGKSEMYDYLRSHNKAIFVNLDDKLQDEKTSDLQRISFSQINTSATVYVESVTANPFVVIKCCGVEISSHLIGKYNATNINASIVIGAHFEVPIDAIKDAVESYIPDNNRSQLISKGTNDIILDAYNANPSSMREALDNFMQLDRSNKIIIIGDMYELGIESLYEHGLIVDYLFKNNTIETHFIGKDFYQNKVESDTLNFYFSFEDFIKNIGSIDLKNKILLIKGSRGMALERILEYI